MARAFGVCFVAILLIGIPILLLFVVKIIDEEKNKVLRLPKVPMTLCDKHGAYPSSATLKLTVPADGRHDLIVEQCPQCYYDQMKQSTRIPR